MTTKKCLDCVAAINAKSANPRCETCTQEHYRHLDRSPLLESLGQPKNSDLYYVALMSGRQVARSTIEYAGSPEAARVNAHTFWRSELLAPDSTYTLIVRPATAREVAAGHTFD